VRRRIVAVEAVQKDDARFAVFPGLRDDPVEDLPGVELARHLAVAGIEEVVIFVFFHRLHEGFGEPHGNVEVIELLVIRLAHDEIHDVRMIDAQNAHVRAAPRSALLDRFRRHVENAHEGNRSAGNAGGGHDDVVGRTQAGKGKSRAAAGLVDKRRVFHRVENVLHGIADR
jgi:hypothetical protein